MGIQSSVTSCHRYLKSDPQMPKIVPIIWKPGFKVLFSKFPKQDVSWPFENLTGPLLVDLLDQPFKNRTSGIPTFKKTGFQMVKIEIVSVFAYHSKIGLQSMFFKMFLTRWLLTIWKPDWSIACRTQRLTFKQGRTVSETHLGHIKINEPLPFAVGDFD